MESFAFNAYLGECSVIKFGWIDIETLITTFLFFTLTTVLPEEVVTFEMLAGASFCNLAVPLLFSLWLSFVKVYA